MNRMIDEMISKKVTELLDELPDGNAIALCVGFIADKVAEDIDDEEKQFETSFAFMDDVRHLIYKYKSKE